MATRIHLTGPTNAHWELFGNPERWVNEIRAAANDASHRTAWVEEVSLDTSPPIDEEEMAKSEGPVGDLLRYFQTVQEDDDAVAALAEELRGLQANLPHEVRRGENALDLSKPGVVRPLLEEAKQILLVRLAEEESEE